MLLNQIDLNLLVVLDAIYTEGGITQAARKLHLTQPAISHSLGRLRDLFGDPLFVREGRSMVATPMARNLIEPLRRSLRGLESALNEAERFDPATTRRRFTIGLRDVLEAIVLPPLMEYVSRYAPHIDIGVVPVDRRSLETDLATGALDAAIDILLPHTERVRRQRFAADRLVVLMRKRHPLAKKRLDLPTYLALDHVVASSRLRGPGLEDLELARRGLQRRVRLRCQHYYTACCVVGVSDLLLTMPEYYALNLNRHFGYRMVPLPLKLPPLDTYIYWHATVHDEPANRWLRAHFARAL
ncbi:MAG TPA: LysR family transcriptional regulator [Polyangia bacterium]